MAAFGYSAGTGKKGAAAEALHYIMRTGHYRSRRMSSPDELIAVGFGNMPEWSKENSLQFFQAADKFERAGGRAINTRRLTLPRGIDHPQMERCAIRTRKLLCGDSHPYAWAVHNGIAADGGEQPHLHIIWSARELDGIERTQENFFRRYNAAHPDRGGAKKRTVVSASKSQRAAAMMAERIACAEICNDALSACNSDSRVDPRSNADRGLIREPEPKLRAEKRNDPESIARLHKSRDLWRRAEELDRRAQESEKRYVASTANHGEYEPRLSHRPNQTQLPAVSAEPSFNHRAERAASEARIKKYLNLLGCRDTEISNYDPSFVYKLKPALPTASVLRPFPGAELKTDSRPASQPMRNDTKVQDRGILRQQRAAAVAATRQRRLAQQLGPAISSAIPPPNGLSKHDARRRNFQLPLPTPTLQYAVERPTSPSDGIEALLISEKRFAEARIPHDDTGVPNRASIRQFRAAAVRTARKRREDEQSLSETRDYATARIACARGAHDYGSEELKPVVKQLRERVATDVYQRRQSQVTAATERSNQRISCARSVRDDLPIDDRPNARELKALALAVGYKPTTATQNEVGVLKVRAFLKSKTIGIPYREFADFYFPPSRQGKGMSLAAASAIRSMLTDNGIEIQDRNLRSGSVRMFGFRIGISDLIQVLAKLTQNELDEWDKRIGQATVDAQGNLAAYHRLIRQAEVDARQKRGNGLN
jgi:hypothetical protein